KRRSRPARSPPWHSRGRFQGMNSPREALSATPPGSVLFTTTAGRGFPAQRVHWPLNCLGPLAAFTVIGRLGDCSGHVPATRGLALGTGCDENRDRATSDFSNPPANLSLLG